MFGLLFRDWRYALLWAVGLTASVGAFFAKGGGHEQLAVQTKQVETIKQAAPAAVQTPAGPAPSPSASPDEFKFGDPMIADPSADPSASPSPAAIDGSGQADPAGSNQ